MTNSEKSLQTIESTDLQEISNALAVLKEKLLPYTKEVSNEEKASMLKMSDKSYAFVEKTYERSITHPEFVPGFLDFEKHKEQVAHMEQLRIMEAQIRELNKATHDTLMKISSNVYQSSLLVYNSVKAAAKTNVTGASEIFEELKVRFEKAKQKNPKKDDTSVA